MSLRAPDGTSRSFHRVLVFVDGRDSVEALLPEVEKVLPGNAVLYSLRVFEDTRDGRLNFPSPSLERARLARPGPPFTPFRLVRGAADPANCILETARLLEIDLIVLGVPRPGLWGNVFRPSLACRILRARAAPVLLLPLRSPSRNPEIRRVLVPVRPWANSTRTLLQVAPPLCRRTGAELVLMGLLTPERPFPEGTSYVTALDRDLASAGCHVRRVDVSGDFAGHILRYAHAHDVDLVLVTGSMGPDGRPPDPRAMASWFLFGSGCPILVSAAA